MRKAEKIFFDFWEFIDSPQKFPFFRVLMDDGESILIHNTLNRNADDFTWISDSDIDFSVLSKFSQKDEIILGYCSDTYNAERIINLPPEHKVSFIESSVIYENSNEERQLSSSKENCSIQRASAEDIEGLKAAQDPSMRHDYIEQISAVFSDRSCGEVFVLKQDHIPVSFLVLEDCVSAKLRCHYKHVSNIFTLPEYRGQGFASYLIRSIMDLYKSNSFLYAADSWSNTASNFLAKASGFSVVGYNQQVQIQKSL